MTGISYHAAASVTITFAKPEPAPAFEIWDPAGCTNPYHDLYIARAGCTCGTRLEQDGGRR